MSKIEQNRETLKQEDKPVPVITEGCDTCLAVASCGLTLEDWDFDHCPDYAPRKR